MTVNKMWLPLTLLVLAGLVTANHEHGWKVGHEYTYLVRSRTLTSLAELSTQTTGILQKAVLVVQVKDENTLGARVSNVQQAQIHTDLPEGWDTEISDQLLELRDLPLSGKPFEIKIKNGVIKDLIVEREIPTWELNMLKSIVGQLQVDTRGENSIKGTNPQIIYETGNFATFKAMEDSVGGMCEVRYDITPLSDQMLNESPELVPIPKFKEDGQHIDITKTKNFARCDQRMNYHFGITESTKWEPGTNDNGQFLTKSSISRIVISGSLKRFTIQSTVTTSKMFVSPRFYDNQNGMVVSRMNLTLGNLKKISKHLPAPSNPESTGNLVYVYDNPFSDVIDRKPGKPVNGVNRNEIKNTLTSSEIAMNDLIADDSGSSSVSSGSISSSEENNFWLPKPTLKDAPQFPLLPNFVGYKGKNIGKSDDIDLFKVTKDLIIEVAHELDDPSSIPAQETLEKFTILTSLIRTMSRKQIQQLESEMQISPKELKADDTLSQVIKQNVWSVFRDAIAQAGTGPALLTIKNWIEKKQIKPLEAADVISRLPKNARTPTAEYVKTLFDLVTGPDVIDEKYLNSTAILAFTELIRLSQVSKNSIHNRYPVHVFGRLISKHDETILQVYIPYLERELKNAIKNKDSTKIQTYILALGSTGHRKILSVFAPFLEGKEPTTVFQRTLIVAGLSKLAELNPRLARTVLYSIYLNTMEAHEVRCAAVYLLMKTNPPLSMLQRMADFTNYDINMNVNSAVISTILSMAELTSPELQDLANKARNAMQLLSPVEYGHEFSHGFVSDSVADDQNMVKKMIINYIGSADHVIPSAAYYGTQYSYGKFTTPATELQIMVSSVKQLLNLAAMPMKEVKHQSERMQTEKIAEELNIVPEEPSLVEGNILWNSKFASRFLPFDSEEIRKIPSLIAKQLINAKNNGNVNLNKLMSYDVTLSFPTETGLPFVFSFRIPILYKLKGSNQIKIDDGLNTNIKSDVRLVYSQKIQGRIGFVVPSVHRHYISGVDVNFQAYAPMKVELDVNVEKMGMKLKLWPLKGEEKANLIHYSVKPYTSAHDILNLRPLLTEGNTIIVLTGETRSLSKDLPSKLLPMFKLAMEGDDTNEEFWDLSIENLPNTLMLPWSLGEDKYCKLDLYTNLDREVKEPVIISAIYETMDVDPKSESSSEWSSTATAVVPISREPNSEERRTQFLKEATKGIKAATSEVLDVQLQLPGDMKTQNVMTVAWATSNVDNKARLLTYWGMNMPTSEMKFEVCSTSQASSSVDSHLFFDKLVKTKPKGDFDIDILFGETCSEQMNIKGEVSQSNELRDLLKVVPVVQKCEEQMQQGNKILQSCQNAADVVTTMDELDMTVNVPSKPLRFAISKLVDAAISMNNVDVQVDTTNPKNAGKDKIDIKCKLTNDFESAHISMNTWDHDLSVADVSVPSEVFNAQKLLNSGQNVDIMDVTDLSDGPTCVLDKTRVQTFDGKEYPLRLGKCWHVVMTTYPKTNPENHSQKLPVPEDESVTILARETEDGKKEVKFIFGKQEMKLISVGGQAKVIIDGEQIKVTKEKGHQIKKNDEILCDIYRPWEDTISVISDIYDIDLAFDGERLMIKTDDKYRNSVRGLCGNFDSDSSNDLMGPRNCLLKNSDEFTATYALVKDQCEGPALENAKKAGKFQCMPLKHQQTQMVSSLKAGKDSAGEDRRERKGCNTFKTKVEEVNGKLCFSVRPVVSCAPGCSPVDTKKKNYQFHCMEVNQASLELKKRVEKGANPDLSQKPVSLMQTLHVPLACKA